MTFVLSEVSIRNLEHVHPDLVAVAKSAIGITEIDFRVTEGLRSLQRQKDLVAAGASKTMNSLHLLQDDGFAHAFDVVALVGGKARWDWPLYHKIAEAMKKVAEDLGVPLEWGGDWRTFKDGPHFQLPRGYKGIQNV